MENDLYTLYFFRGKVKVKHEYFSLCPSALPNLHGRTTWLRALQHPGDKIKHTFTSFFLKWWPFQGPGRESVAWCIPRGYEVTKPPFLCELGCNQDTFAMLMKMDEDGWNAFHNCEGRWQLWNCMTQFMIPAKMTHFGYFNFICMILTFFIK